jgi:predicted DNA-binding transcriptional regulator AlpA
VRLAAVPRLAAAGGGSGRMSTVLRMILLTISQVCEQLDISRSTFEKWRARRIGPSAIVLPNGSLRIRQDELESWLLSREVA